ncbi:Ctr copper transporter [Gongronella butleri]|nr:Ctr copper transporter [Gongronella butleri]
MSSHDMSSMNMGTFHWSSSGDAFWLNSFVPQNEPAYIGACIGLFVFAIASRGILALEVYFIAWRSRRYADHREAVLALKKDDDRSSTCSEGVTYPTQQGLPSVPPFSWVHDPVRSVLTTLSAFLSYLLMMVVMTGNGGYFLVIIVGIFVGEMAFGRYRSITGMPGIHEGHSH